MDSSSSSSSSATTSVKQIQHKPGMVPVKGRTRGPLNTRYARYVATRLLLVAAVPCLLLALWQLFEQQREQLESKAAEWVSAWGPLAVVWVAVSGWGLLALLSVRRQRRKVPVYVVDFACYKPADSRKCTPELMEYFARRLGVYTEKTMDFYRKVFAKAGVGDQTYAPPSMFHHPSADLSWPQVRAETEEVMFGALDELFSKTGIRPRDVGVLVVNSSCFNPTPSLSSTVVNHYKMSEETRTFNLGGMGCSAGIIAVDLAADLLRQHAASTRYAVVVSTENTTHNLYRGNYRPMLVTNCLFRVGGAAILLTNSPRERGRAKYELLHTVRTHTGADDRAYNCIMQEEDADGVLGVNLTKHIMVAAADALKKNLTRLGPLVLPLSEQLRFAASFIACRLGSGGKTYIPDFKTAFDHFLLHAGGRAVVDELERSLRLTPDNLEACRMTLHRFGNTSSSCVWYELAYLEAKGEVRWGDVLWQLGVGSGFKSNSAVWRALRDIPRPTSGNPWLDDIDKYPVNIPVDAEDVARDPNLHFRTVDGALVFCHTGQVVYPDKQQDSNKAAAPPTPPPAHQPAAAEQTVAA